MTLHFTAIVVAFLFVQASPPAPPPEYVRVVEQLRPAQGFLEWSGEFVKHPQANKTVTQKWTAHECALTRETNVNPAAPFPEDRVRIHRQFWNQTTYFSRVGDSGGDAREFDLPEREIGLDAVVLGQSIGGALTPVKWETRREGDVTIVDVLEVAESGREQARRLWIDHAKGGNVTRAQVLNDGRVIYEITMSVEESDGFWFPRQIEMKLHGEPYSTFRVQHVELDPAKLPNKLTPEEIGIEVGTILYFRTKDRQILPGAAWDGQRVAPMGEVYKKIRSGELTMGPNCRALTALQEARIKNRKSNPRRAAAEEFTMDFLVSADPERDPKLWESVVKGVIAKYNLRDQQAAAAWKIHADCVEQAERALNARSDDLAKLDQLYRACREAPSLEEKACKQYGALKEKIVAPIEEIYIGQLIPRLQRLLDRKQQKVEGPILLDSRDEQN